MEEVLRVNETWADTYSTYMSHVFKTSGEQLKERMGFFMRSTYRDFFYTLGSLKVVDDMFSICGSDLDVYVSFENFCNSKSKVTLQLEKEEVCRPLLMILVEISFFFYVYKHRKLCSEDHVDIVKKCVRKLERV